MLQISQTEKPICSAIIDQMRLRRAITLPLAFQKFSFSGFHSEIQVVFGWFIGDFLLEFACSRSGWWRSSSVRPFAVQFRRTPPGVSSAGQKKTPPRVGGDLPLPQDSVIAARPSLGLAAMQKCAA